MLELFLALVGGVAGMIGASAAQFRWRGSFWNCLLFWTSFIAFVGGIFVWDYEKRAESWSLTDWQKKKLSEVVDVKEADKFPIAFFSLNAEALSSEYIYQIMDAFQKAKWRIIYSYPNFIRPENAQGLYITKCDKNPMPSHMANVIDEQENQIVSFFERTKTKIIKGPSTEQFLGKNIPINITVYGFPECTVGIVAGKPPSPCERINPYASWIPNIYCKVSDGHW